nr:pentapeptide repeat-containing protein [Lachnospiraceae bacterium]
MSGQDAQRGFIYQTIVAMIECLDKPDWDAIKLEPETKNDKVDISFYANGRMLRAIQVKSRSGAFNENDVQGWLDEIEKDAQDEKPGEVWLYLVGSEYKNDCIKFIADVNESGKKSRPKKHIEPLKFQDIKTYCIGKLCQLHGELITSKEVRWTYPTLLGIVHENSISNKKLSHDDFRSVLFKNIKSASDNGKALQIAKTVRKLSDNLWINWKTGRLGDSLESALYGGGKDECILDSAGLRLLSVLVQGEGAVVGWDELVRRGIRMHEEMEELRSQSRGEEESPAAVGREPDSAEAESDDLEKYPSAEEEKEILQKALETARQYFARGVEIRLEEVEPKVREAVAAVRRLCGKAPALSGIVKAAENGMGFRIVLPGPGSQSVGDFFPEVEGEKVEETSQKNGYTEAGLWLSRYYADVCSSFEERISNAGSKYGEMGQDYDENKNAETDVFGGYTMAESYMNAYAAEEDVSETRAMLDYTEEWYYSGEKADADSRRSWYSGNKKTARKYGRVLVIHGEPGDGKTTFCKKAVYAHCLEGWLSDVPHVLRISLNIAENETLIRKEKNADGEGQELYLSKSLCISGFENNYLLFDPENLKDQEGTLVIFDGYDELDGELAKCEKTRDFAAFYEKVTEFAKYYKCNAIITSRTMCIERELAEKSKRLKIPSVKFAPLTYLQQEMMIDRMVELDRGKHGAWYSQGTAAADNGGITRKTLELYREQNLPNLRQSRIQELMSIPTLFRMIVTLRFENASNAETETEAGLYGRLFHSLMLYKNKKNNEERDLIRYYEKIAARIFKHDNDTCPFGIGDDSNNKELLYIFLTKSGAKKEGQIGFLHGSFRQYFLARYLVSSFQELNAKNDKRELHELIKYLCVRRIDKSLVWQLIYELTKLKGTGQDPFFEIGDKAPVTVNDIKAVRNCLDNELADMSFMAGIEDPDSAKKPKDWRWTEVENAVFNLLGALSASEKALAESGKESDHYKNYQNITRLLRGGNYQDIYIENADFSDCDLSRADFKNAQLTSALLLRTTFKEANLLEANLEGADLRGVNLAKANLAGAILRNGQFVEANLTKADLSGADLTDAYFDWTKSEGEKKTLFDAEKLTTLREANLSGAKMVKTHLKDADLERAILENADLRGALLEGANLSGAKLAGADLTGAKMAGADLLSADLRGACLIGADLTGAHMEGACLDRAILKGSI